MNCITQCFWYYISAPCGCDHRGNGHFLISDPLCLCGWALLICIVHGGVCHWSSQEIWGRRGLGEGEKYLNNLTRKYEILLIIVYIAKTWEPNRIDPDLTKTLETAETFVFLYVYSAARRRTLLWSSWEPRPDNSSQTSRRGGERRKYKGAISRHTQALHLSEVKHRGSPLCGAKRSSTADEGWSLEIGMWWGSPSEDYRKAGSGYPEWSRPPRGICRRLPWLTTAPSPASLVHSQHASDAAVDAALPGRVCLAPGGNNGDGSEANTGPPEDRRSTFWQ